MTPETLINEVTIEGNLKQFLLVLAVSLLEVIRVNSTPLSESGWIAVCQNAGLQVEKCQTGAMGLLNLSRMLQDEGFVGTVRILWNILSRSQIRDRILAMRRVFQHYQQDLGYIAICAKKQS